MDEWREFRYWYADEVSRASLSEYKRDVILPALEEFDITSFLFLDQHCMSSKHLGQKSRFAKRYFSPLSWMIHTLAVFWPKSIFYLSPYFVPEVLKRYRKIIRALDVWRISHDKTQKS